MKGCLKTEFVKDLVPGTRVSSRFGVMKKSLARFSPTSSRSGESYVKLVLCDRTGTIQARVWDNAVKAYQSFEVDDVVHVEGQVVSFDGPQLNVSRIEKVALSPAEKSLYRPSSPREVEVMWDELRSISATVGRAELRSLLDSFLEDEVFSSAFKVAPAGRSVHHAYSGGLLEHTIEVVKIAEKIAEPYDRIASRDLVVCGSILHDIGKILEYDLDSLTFELTDSGRLLGHVVMGSTLLSDRVRLIGGFSERLGMHLHHVIISHHGQREWGSPEVPKTIEAFLVFHADLASARASQFASLVRSHRESEGSWTAWDRLLDRSAFVGRREEPGEALR